MTTSFKKCRPVSESGSRTNRAGKDPVGGIKDTLHCGPGPQRPDRMPAPARAVSRPTLPQGFSLHVHGRLGFLDRGPGSLLLITGVV